MHGRTELERSQALASQIDDVGFARWILVYLALAFIRQGDLLDAQELLEQSVAIHGKLAPLCWFVVHEGCGHELIVGDGTHRHVARWSGAAKGAAGVGQ